MLVVQITMFAIALILIPTIVGSLFFNVDRDAKKLCFMWISGQMLLWAGFQLICVPMILLEKKFTTVYICFNIYTVMLVISALVLYFFRKHKGKLSPCLKVVSKEQKNIYYILWVLFWCIFIFQIIQCFRLAYADGDDAFYVATSVIAEESDTMYRKLAYTGGTTQVDVRYGLAPFPMWIAFFARLLKIRTVTVAQVLVPPVLIGMAYAVYYLLGSRLFIKHKERVPLFMIFTEILVLFGDYSIYTSERFLIARSRQGKAALCAIVIPFLIFWLLVLMEKMEEKVRVNLAYWGVLLCALTAACLCSTLGAVLACMLIGVTGLCGAVCYRNWKILVPMAVCCIPCVVEALFYLVN